ncbi:hypothetical protein F511_35516 [Dorcoceras hygrometricum]|uniref:Uncharacterized protein n=1 Tax=Dorcoceras hygrometricum TaxID=472368 RepID=A0A2Z7BXZ5_9LAMI|nr:hypothetical protein F511_35516 [Dorcoceras hygrometricum]
MDRCSFQNNSFVSSEEMKNATVVCPKPRRLSRIEATVSEPSSMRPLRWHVSYQQEIFDVKARNELLDIILTKGDCSDQSVKQHVSIPPFFSGSPPSRVSNPLIQDSRFANERFTPVSAGAMPTSSGLGSSPSSTRKGGLVRANYGISPTVRVEGFDYLNRDRRRILTLA